MYMTFKKTAICALSAFVLAACDNGGGIGSFGGGANDGPRGGVDTIGTSNLGGANDPSSVAYFQQTIGDRVLFVVDQASLTPEAMSILDGQADWMNRNTQFNLTVEGHADEQGTREYNLALGARRAASVQNYLVSKGVADNRITTVTFGKERPIEICSTEACWSKNRRAVSVVAGGALGS